MTICITRLWRNARCCAPLQLRPTRATRAGIFTEVASSIGATCQRKTAQRNGLIGTRERGITMLGRIGNLAGCFATAALALALSTAASNAAGIGSRAAQATVFGAQALEANSGNPERHIVKMSASDKAVTCFLDQWPDKIPELPNGASDIVVAKVRRLVPFPATDAEYDRWDEEVNGKSVTYFLDQWPDKIPDLPAAAYGVIVAKVRLTGG